MPIKTVFRSIICALALLTCASTFAVDPPAKAEVDSVIAQAARFEPGQDLRPFRQLEDWVRRAPSNKVLQTELEGGFIRLLAPTSTFEARRFACKQLAVIGTDLSLPTLGALLKQQETVAIACLALTTYPQGKADELLRSALASSTGLARLQLVRTVGDRRDPASLNLLAAVARDQDREISDAAIISMGKVGGREGWRVLSILRQRAKPEQQVVFSDATLRCAASLSAIGEPRTAAAIYESLLRGPEPDYIRRGAFSALIRLSPDERRILSILRGHDTVLRPIAISAVSTLRSSDASATFSKELPKLPTNEQVWMIDSLAARNDPVTRAAITKELASPAPAVRHAAIVALGNIGDSRTIASLAPMLKNSSDAEQTRALQASLLILGGGSKTDEAIVAELKSSSGAQRAILIDVISQRLGPAANPSLFDETASADPTVAKAACRALARTATAADLPVLLQKLVTFSDPSVRAEAESAAAQSLARIDSASQRSILVCAALNQTNSVESRCSLIGLLPVCGDPQALEALNAAAGDPSSPVRNAAIQALADWPDAGAWDSLIAVYHNPANESLRGIALRGLVRIVGDENPRANSQLAERYMDLLRGARGDADLKLILGAIGGAARPETLQLAIPLLSNAGVRPEAEVAVKRIAEAIKGKYPDAAKDALTRLKATN